MKDQFRRRAGRLTLLLLVATVLGALLAASAVANNLDRNTAQRALKQVAKRDCRATSGCESYKAEPVRLITYHRASGKIHVISHKNGIRWDCRRGVVLKLNHYTGRITYRVGARRCVNLGPQKS